MPWLLGPNGELRGPDGEDLLGPKGHNFRSDANAFVSDFRGDAGAFVSDFRGDAAAFVSDFRSDAAAFVSDFRGCVDVLWVLPSYWHYDGN